MYHYQVALLVIGIGSFNHFQCCIGFSASGAIKNFKSNQNYETEKVNN